MDDVELLRRCLQDKHMCDYCKGDEWCITEFSQRVRNEYAQKYGCICGAQCRQCRNYVECRPYGDETAWIYEDEE